MATSRDSSGQLSGEIEIEHEDRTYRADYTYAGGLVTVSSAFGSKSQAAGSHDPKNVAQLLLRELINLEMRQPD